MDCVGFVPCMWYYTARIDSNPEPSPLRLHLLPLSALWFLICHATVPSQGCSLWWIVASITVTIHHSIIVCDKHCLLCFKLCPMIWFTGLTLFRLIGWEMTLLLSSVVFSSHWLLAAMSIARGEACHRDTRKYRSQSTLYKLNPLEGNITSISCNAHTRESKCKVDGVCRV